MKYTPVVYWYRHGIGVSACAGDTGHILDTGNILDTKHLTVGQYILGIGYNILGTGRYILNIGYYLLVLDIYIGIWILGTIHQWVLDNIYWSLSNGK